MLRSLILFFSSLLSLSLSQFTSPNLGGSIGCVVTKNKLYSSGNYIRDLTEPEVKILIQYKKDMVVFKKKISDAFDNAEQLESTKNGTIPPMPTKPSMPPFCTGKDTTMYIFAGCSIQNSKVYIGKSFARDLDRKERSKLEKFSVKMAENQAAIAKDPSAVTTSPLDLQKDLDFCTEF